MPFLIATNVSLNYVIFLYVKLTFLTEAYNIVQVYIIFYLITASARTVQLSFND